MMEGGSSSLRSDDSIFIRQAKDQYFLDSATKVHFFFEADSFDEKTGELLRDKRLSMNKVGHAIHWYVPAFKEITFSSRLKAVARSLSLRDPVIVQGMYIFKSPRIGSAGMRKTG